MCRALSLYFSTCALARFPSLGPTKLGASGLFSRRYLAGKLITKARAQVHLACDLAAAAVVVAHSGRRAES